MIENSFELLKHLKNLGYIKNERDPLWWPNSGSFEVVIGAVLTQNTKWENVEKSLANIKNHCDITLENLTAIDPAILATLVRPSGFFNQKAARISTLCKNISEAYGDFENFCEGVNREWLLSQKGIGFESADAILNYACKRDILCVDAYSARILKSLGYEFESYEDLQYWLQKGITENLDAVFELYGKEMELYEIYARFHGKIVEFCKEGKKLAIP